MGWGTIGLFAAGVVALLTGAEWLLRGATRLALAAGVSTLVVGLTVVAVGTGSPELAVAIRSALLAEGGITVGNVVGANVINVLVILGASAVIRPLAVSERLVRLDVPVMIAASLLLLLLSRDGRLSRGESALLLAGMVAYTVHLIHEGRRRGVCPDDYPEALCEASAGDGAGHWALQVGLMALGVGLLWAGATAMVNAAVSFARAMGIDDLVIGLTIVSLGTTTPEAATSIVSAYRGRTDLAVGNAVGSFLVNILVVLPVAGLLARGGLSVPADALRFDLPVMVGVAVACLPVFFVGRCIARWEGFLFLGYYIVYTVYLYLRAVQHLALATFERAMLWFVLPLTAITLLTLLVRAVRAERQAGG